MTTFVDYIARSVRLWREVIAEKWSFLALFVLIFGVSVAALARLDLLPERMEVEVVAGVSVTQEEVEEEPVEEIVIEVPTRVMIPAIGVDASVENPGSSSVEVLDQSLLSGAVRYPTSAELGEDGNVVLFGHSSYLPVVGNQAYKAFNDIQKLEAGERVIVYSGTRAYTYAVRTVSKESADANAAIPLQVSGKVLTLVTCNSFGKKSDRFVVVADLVESHLIGA